MISRKTSNVKQNFYEMQSVFERQSVGIEDWLARENLILPFKNRLADSICQLQLASETKNLPFPNFHIFIEI